MSSSMETSWVQKMNEYLAPLGFYRLDYVKEVLRLYYEGLNIRQIAVYFECSVENINHIIDLYLPIVELTGKLTYEESNGS